MPQKQPNLLKAIQEWQQVLGNEVLSAETALRDYGFNTIGIERRIAAAIKPAKTAEIVEIVKIAAKYRIQLYPISSGHNWGYGSANPVVNDCVIVDLSSMNRVLEVDAESGIITIEPGVTQKHLRDYLDSHNLDFLVPVHGGGPHCSLVGNAIERGYGITPYADHFGAVTALEAVLPNGEIYRSALSEMGGSGVDRAFKWGIGPYIDGIFTQGSFGIVTQMTIALAPIPERVLNFSFWIERDESMEDVVGAIRSTLRLVGANCGSINLMNPLRVLSMMENFPTPEIAPEGVIPPKVISEMARRNMLASWMGTGAIYGSKPLANATRSIIKKQLGPLSRRIMFLSPQGIRRLKGTAHLIPGSLGQRLVRLTSTLDSTIRLIAGSPSEIALPLAYWRSGRIPDKEGMMNPAKDGCGLIWYAPLVPMKPERVRVFVEMVKKVCLEHRINPLITLTSLSDRCFDSTIPLLFDRANKQEAEKAQDCYEALFEAGKKEGFLPYRVGVQSMHLITDHECAYWNLVSKLKSAIDPENIIAPSRYCPLKPDQ
jgi:4-cresol dehydrogenase (hydroxylating)